MKVIRRYLLELCLRPSYIFIPFVVLCQHWYNKEPPVIKKEALFVSLSFDFIYYTMSADDASHRKKQDFYTLCFTKACIVPENV